MTANTLAPKARRFFAWLGLGLGAAVSAVTTGFVATNLSQTDLREKVVGAFALAVFVLAVDSLAKARAGVRSGRSGLYRWPLGAVAALTAFAFALLVYQIARLGLVLDIRTLTDAVFVSIGLVVLGQALFAE